jgi:uncharacterized iron-regulated membrane protein
MLDRVYLSLSGAALFIAQNQPEAPGGRGDDPGGGALGVILGIAVAFIVVAAVVFFVLRSRAGRRGNPRRSPKSPRGRTGV